MSGAHWVLYDSDKMLLMLICLSVGLNLHFSISVLFPAKVMINAMILILRILNFMVS